MERPLITAVTHSTDEARITLLGVPDHPGIAGRIFTALADANVNVDMIIQNEPVSEGAQADMSFTVPRADLRAARAALEPVVGEVGIGSVADDPEMGKVSVVGAGMKSHPGVAAKVFSTLGDEGINIEMISTSPIKISCVVRGERVDQAVRALHEAFELGADAGRGRASLRSGRAHERLPRRRRRRHGRRRHRHARASCASAASRRARSSRSPPSAPPGRELERRRHRPAADRRDDPGLRHRDLLGRRRHVGRVGAALRRRGRRRRRQLLALAHATPRSRSSSPRSTRRRSTATRA